MSVKRLDQFDLIETLATDDQLVIWDGSESRVNNVTLQQINDYIVNNIVTTGSPFVTVGLTDSGATYEVDGIADDVQIQEAIDYVNGLGGGEVRILAGTYDIDDTITTYSNIVISGEGAATLLDASAMPVGGSHKFVFSSTSASNKNDFVFRDIAIKCFFTAGTSGTYATFPASSGIRVANARRVLVQNCYFQDTWNATTIGQNPDTNDDSMGATNIKQVIFDGNQCNNVLGGLQGYSEDRVIWVNNHFEDVGDDACAFLGANNLDPSSVKGLIANNTFVNGRPVNSNGVDGVGIFLKVDGGGHGAENITDITCIGNVVDEAYIGIQFANGSRGIIMGNDVLNCYRSAIYISGGTREFIISNNNLYDNNTSGNSSQASIYTINTSDTKIDNNRIQGTSTGNKQGINIEGTMSNISVCNNQIKDCTGFAAIYCETFTNGKFDNNQIINGAKGIIIGGTDGSCSNNDFYGTFSSTKLETTTVTRVRIKNNGGVNPELLYAQGNVTGSVTFNRANGNVITATQTGSITPTVSSGIIAGDTLDLILTQDATGGRAVTWPSNVKFPGGTATVHNTTANAVNHYHFVYDGTNWRGSGLLDTTKYIPADGSTQMTADLILYSNPTAALASAPKQYVDSRLLRSGDTVTGAFKTLKNIDITNQYTRGATGETPTIIRTGGENTKGLRIVGGSPWLPSDIATCKGWWKADSIYGLEDGANVSSWSDSSGTSNTATQSTTARQPVYVKNQLNGYPVVRFTQASQHYLQFDFSSLVASDFTLVVVEKRPSGTLNTAYFFGNSDSNYGLQFGYSTNSSLRFRFGNPQSTLDGTPGTANQFNITVGRLEQATGRTEYVNGSSAGSNATLTNIPSGNTGYIGRGDTGGYYQGDIAEIMVFNGALSSGDREKVEGYLAEKYDLRSYLPGGHTYKSSLPTGTAQAVDYIEILDESGTTKAKITKDGIVTASGFVPLSGITTYTASNVSTDRSYDANATTVDELADVLGTLIADLRTIGLIL